MNKQHVFGIANYFLLKDKKENGDTKSIDNLKLNKLVYIALGFSYGFNEFELFDEPVEAWTFGPVVPPIYYQFKDNANLPIKNLAIRSNKETPEIGKSEIEILEVLEKVWKHYSSKKGAEFIELTHREGTPWSVSEKGQVIEREIIKKYYKDFITALYN